MNCENHCYCPDCHILTTQPCARCAGPTRQAKPDDPVLILRGNTLVTDQVAPLLDSEGIPFSKISTLGQGFVSRAGNLLETYQIFVPWSAYDQSQEVLAVFEPDSDVAKARVLSGP